MIGKPQSGIDVKRQNRNDIYNLLWREKRLSKQDIMQRLGLSLPTVTNNLNSLCAEGLVVENGAFAGTGGRSAKGYSIEPTARLAVGVDINRTHIAVVVADLYGNVAAQAHEHRRYEKTDAYYRRVGELAPQTMAKLSLQADRLLGVGISIQGLLSPDRQRVVFGPILDNTGETAATIARHIPYTCELFHDADMAAFAELWVSPEVENALYISLSTNLGGSVIIGRELFHGSGSIAGKVEHMTLHPGGRPCYCGQQGCADAYCSVTHLTGGFGEGGLPAFFALLEKGDTAAKARWAEYSENLAILLNSLYMLMDSKIILGGYMAPYLEPHLAGLRRQVAQRNGVLPSGDFISVGRFQSEAVAAGAALQYVNRFLKTV